MPAWKTLRVWGVCRFMVLNSVQSIYDITSEKFGHKVTVLSSTLHQTHNSLHHMQTTIHVQLKRSHVC